MRVLDTRSGQFVEINPKDKDINYAILSHTWDPEGEQTYQTLLNLQKQYRSRGYRWWRIAWRAATGLPSELWHQNQNDRSLPTSPKSQPTASAPVPPHIGYHRLPLSPIWDDSRLSPKIREACRVARENGYRYLWIDSCCIDKTSSSELSESINSMYQWYAHADVCYAFLPDVPAEEDHHQEKSRFRASRWFRRGWTLQELIAPLDVRFLSMEWAFIGSKEDLTNLVVEITNIQHDALLNIEPLGEFSVAQRFSWAARRETTRKEDRAYSLLGIFSINMPTLYGEGEAAFRRLQEEIMRRTPDQSLFAWAWFETLDCTSPHDSLDVGFSLSTHPMPFLAPSYAYKFCAGIKALSHDEVARRLQLQPKDLPARRYDFTPYGICVQLPVIPFSPEHIDNATNIPLSQWYLVILGCGHRNFPGYLLARICYIQSSGSSTEFLHSGWISSDTEFDLVPLSPTTITQLRSAGGQVSIKTLYIPQPERDQGAHNLARQIRHKTIKLVLLEKTCEALSTQGYTATLRSPDDAHPHTHLVILSHDTHAITIDYQHTLGEREDGCQELTIKAEVKTSGPVQVQDTPGDPRILQADGLGSGVSWLDYSPWQKELRLQDVELTDIPGGPTALTVRLGLTLSRTNYFVLRIEVKTADPQAVLAHAPVAEMLDALDGRPDPKMPPSCCRTAENVDVGAVAANDIIAGPMPGHQRGSMPTVGARRQMGEGAPGGGQETLKAVRSDVFPVMLLTVMATFSLIYVAVVFVVVSLYVTCFGDAPSAMDPDVTHK